eukprot:jgi/Ulvmu1/4121/UM019_0100.1
MSSTTEDVARCMKCLEWHMDDAMIQNSQHTVAARAYLSQLWLSKRQPAAKQVQTTSYPKVQLAELPAEARDVLREVFRLYAAQGAMSRAMFAVLARQANMLDGQTCSIHAVDLAYQHGVYVSKHLAATDFNGFFEALQTLSMLRHNMDGLSAILQDCSILAALVSAEHAAQVPLLAQAAKTDAYAEAFSGHLRRRLEVLFGHYSVPRKGGIRKVDLRMCHSLAKEFKLIPRLVTTKQLQQCFQAIKVLYIGNRVEVGNTVAGHLGKSQFVDLIMLCALIAFGHCAGTDSVCRLNLADYSDAARSMWIGMLMKESAPEPQESAQALDSAADVLAVTARPTPKQERPWYLSVYKHDWVAAESAPYMKPTERSSIWMPTSQSPEHIAGGLKLPAKLYKRMVKMVMRRYEAELSTRDDKTLQQLEDRDQRRHILHDIRHRRRGLQERSGQARR